MKQQIMKTKISYIELHNKQNTGKGFVWDVFVHPFISLTTGHWSLTTGLIFAFVFLSLTTYHLPLAEARQAIIAGFSGMVDVQLRNMKDWKKAMPKMLLKETEKIRTGKKSKATLIFEDGSRTEVYPETTLVMNQLAAPISLQQTSGKTLNKVKKLGRGFSLKTPTAVCSVRGTEFAVGIENGGVTKLDVFDGTVNGEKTATGESMDVVAGKSLYFTNDKAPLGTPLDAPQKTGGEEDSIKQMAKKEVGLDMTREQIQAAAAEEMKLAEYQEGKSLIDVNGYRVRLEEYILRKPKDVAAVDRDKAFKFVVLNTRENRFDYFTYKGIFNKTLPDDLSVALRNATGRALGSEPEYYMTSYEMTQSNLTDAIKDMADGGHLVEVTYDPITDKYTLKAHNVGADGKAGTVTDTITQKGQSNGKNYDPIADVYKNSGVPGDGIYDPVSDTFKNMGQADTLWRTVYNRYGHLLGSSKDLASLTLDNVPAAGITLTQPWFQYYVNKSGVQNICTLENQDNAAVTSDGTMTVGGKTLDLVNDQPIGNASYRYLNGHYAFDSSMPAGNDQLYMRLMTYYPKSNSDIPFEQYDTYIISDEGKIAPISAFANATSGQAYKQELLKWNYEQRTSCSSYGDRDIDLVVEPKILIRSGLIK